MFENDREKYIKFWKEFGKAIKPEFIQITRMNRDKLQDLLMFESSHSDELTTLDEYVKRMPEGRRKYIMPQADKDAVKNTPQMEAIREKGYEVLYFIDKIDEFRISRHNQLQGKTAP